MSKHPGPGLLDRARGWVRNADIKAVHGSVHGFVIIYVQSVYILYVVAIRVVQTEVFGAGGFMVRA